MTRLSRRSITGIRGRGPAVAAALALLALAPAAGVAQTLKLHGLHFPPRDLVGTWVSFHGRSQSRGSTVREFDQRLAVVGKENLGKNRWGLWVELKTTDARGTSRIERGLFASKSLRGKDLLPGGDAPKLGVEEGAPTGDDANGNATNGQEAASEPAPSDDGDLVLVRYQAMNGNKLYEYPVSAGRHARTGGDVSTFELFEYDPSVTPIKVSLGPDTLRLGRRVIPAQMDRVRRYGADEWPSNDDSTGIQRLVLTQTFWRNPAVPLTGFARSVFKAEMRHLPWSSSVDSLLSGIPRAARPDSTMLAAAERVAAQADSLLQDGVQAATPGPGANTLAWTELSLSDLGADAKPEVNQLPELPPDDENAADPGAFQR